MLILTAVIGLQWFCLKSARINEKGWVEDGCVLSDLQAVLGCGSGQKVFQF